ncbi:MAG: hypothetical protein H6926_06910 [Chromatiales bacterium]|nr:hypothetical protein [Gammaproteobacteria bacterium]MCP5230638.1 hypothetical protein [Zoogloeaceae bacterium]MCP5352899.1 hypothetical protein [Chromatiales bacterium]
MDFDALGIDTMGLPSTFDGDQSDWLARLSRAETRIAQLGPHAPAADLADVYLEKGRALVALERGGEGWPLARQALDVYLGAQRWEAAVDACDVLFRADQDGSLAALGQGIWLAVTFPIDLELTLSILYHVIDETPDDSDGAAVAAATAVFLADLRASDEQRENLTFFANQMLGKVSRRHSNVESQLQFQAWIMRMELDDPDKFLIRLRNVIDVLVQDEWWFDRDAVRDSIPED